jgi:phosphate:Na+ symporter
MTMSLIFITGGVALLLFAVRFLRKGLDRLFGRRLVLWMQRIGGRPAPAFFTGLGVAACAPSSTTVSLMAVNAVQAGHMTARQMLIVMLGANIGLTVMVQLVALPLDAVAPLLILIGVILYQYTEATRTRGMGQIILALGLIFLAMGLIKQGVPADISPEHDLGRMIEILAGYPVLIVFLAVVLAMLMQSSTAAIGLVMALAITGAIDFDVAVPAVLGANVGLALTTLVIGWRSVESRRLGMANLVLKAIVALLGLALLPLLIGLLDGIQPGYKAQTIATLHTGFNIVTAVVGLPLVGVISTALVRAVPEPRGGKVGFGPRYIIGGPVGSTSLALGQSLREIMHVAEIVRVMLVDLWEAQRNSDEHLAREVARRDDQVDLLDGEIKRYLTRAIKEDADADDNEEQMRQLRYLSELETIGDIIDKNLSQLVLKKIRLGASFSKQGQEELDEFFRRVLENLTIADTCFTTRDPDLARQILTNKDELDLLEQKLRDRHFDRLNRGLQESHETSAIHLDLLTHLKRINSSVSYVAYAILKQHEGSEVRRAESDQ